MGKRYSTNIFLSLGFIFFVLLVGKNGYIYAESMEDASVEEVIVNALYGVENNNADEFMADFSKQNFKGKVMRGANEGKILGYEEFKNDFIAASARRTILSVDDISFLDIKISDNDANVSVEFSVSIFIPETYKTVEAQPSISVVLKKDDDGWKIREWNWPGPLNAAPLYNPQE